MENRHIEMRFTPGAQARIYTGEGWRNTVVRQVSDGLIFLDTPGGSTRLAYNQPVSLAQRLQDGSRLMVLLRYQERGRNGGRVQDRYAIVPGTMMQLDGGLHRVQMYAWCDLTVFEVHRPERVFWEGKAYLFELSGSAAGVIVAGELPQGAFAECAFSLGGEPVTAQLMVERVEKPVDSALSKAQLSFIDPALQLKIEEYLMEERARRMRNAGY